MAIRLLCSAWFSEDEYTSPSNWKVIYLFMNLRLRERDPERKGNEANSLQDPELVDVVIGPSEKSFFIYLVQVSGANVKLSKPQNAVVETRTRKNAKQDLSTLPLK